MCKVLEKRDEKIYMQFKSQLEEMDAELAEKDAEIAALKAKLTEFGH